MALTVSLRASLALFAIGSVCVASSTWASPQHASTPLYRGIQGLGARLDRRVSADVHEVEHRTALSYDVEHETAHGSFVTLADDPRVVGVIRCVADLPLAASTVDEVSAKMLATELSATRSVVVGFCAESEDAGARATSSFSGAVVSAVARGRSVILELRRLALTDIIRNGNATLTAELAQSRGPGAMVADDSCPSACVSCIQGGGGTGCESACSSCSDTCTTCVKFAGGLACAERCTSDMKAQCTLGDLLEGHCTASAQWSHQWDGWTLVNEDGKVIYKHGIFDADAEIVCEQCHAHLTPSVVVNIAVVENSLQSLDITVTGAYSAVANVSAIMADSFSKSGTKSLDVPSIPSINFFLGAFPIHISFDVTTTAGYSLEASGRAQAYSGLTIDGSVKAGATYVKGDSVKPVWDSQFNPAVIPPGGAVAGTATVTATLQPSLTVKVDEVGSANLSLKPTVTLDASLQDTCVQGTLNAGMSGELSATIGLQLAGHTLGPAKTFGPKDVLDKNWPDIWTGKFGC